MSFYADLHIHSHYSRATSPLMNLEALYKWAQIKGITVLGTGDFTHPAYFNEIDEKLEADGNGLFVLKDKFAKKIDKAVPGNLRRDVKFLLSVEISSIYKKNEKTRKVHNLIFAPSIKAAGHINSALQKLGNIASDGRPILGLDSKKLLKIVLDSDPYSMLIPAHAWTPHFSVLGSKSGFDSLEECFDELTPNIYAIETGLSSDPKMNWMLSALDDVVLISNSDAHSPTKLAREANIFDCNLSYFEMINAIKNKDKKKFIGTIEFFPEHGKYHLDGHRACNKCLTPEETRKYDYLCPTCGRKVTVGVMHRVIELADRKEGVKSKSALPYTNLIPLPDILAEALDVGCNSKKVMNEYFQLTSSLGNELAILQDVPINEIVKSTKHPIIPEAIKRVRENKVRLDPGYDGEFGKVRIFGKEERERIATGQMRLF